MEEIQNPSKKMLPLFFYLTDLSGLLVALGLLQRGGVGVGRRRPPAFYLFGAHFTPNITLS